MDIGRFVSFENIDDDTKFYLITITGSNAQILSSPCLPHPIENFVIIGSNGSLGCATQELFDSAFCLSCVLYGC